MDDQVNPQFLFVEYKLRIGELGISHPCNGHRYTHLFTNPARQDIHFVIVGHGSQHIGIMDLRIF